MNETEKDPVVERLRAAAEGLAEAQKRRAARLQRARARLGETEARIVVETLLRLATCLDVSPEQAAQRAKAFGEEFLLAAIEGLPDPTYRPGCP